jgi:hypothetical protein
VHGFASGERGGHARRAARAARLRAVGEGAGGHPPRRGEGGHTPPRGKMGGRAAAPRGRGEGRMLGEREGEGGREERGGGAHLGIQQSAITVHQIT